MNARISAYNSFDDFPESLFLPEQVRAIDSHAINQVGIPGYDLMFRAGEFAFKTATRLWPEATKWFVFCGAGNNAGDGYIVAGLAKQSGLDATIVYLSDPSRLTEDAKTAFEFASAEHVPTISFRDYLSETQCDFDLIIDALFGTGLNKTVEGDYALAIDQCNQAECPIMAIDIPSGLSASSGQPLGSAVRASATTTFIALKLGSFTGQGRKYSGSIYFSDLAVPASSIKTQEPTADFIHLANDLKILPPRDFDAHKGKSGRVSLIGGHHGFGGAIILATKSCIMSGAGLTSIATQAENITPLLAHCPEAMPRSIQNNEDLKSLISESHCIAIGPGLGQTDWSKNMLSTALEVAYEVRNTPTVLDADALNILADSEEQMDFKGLAIMTPHPGEAARLLNTTVASIELDRLNAVKDLSSKYNAIVVLKGSGTLIASTSDSIALCAYGNAGMATGGMGDILSGLIASIVAQLVPPKTQALTPDVLWRAARLGVAIHARAADILAQKHGERGLLPSELAPVIRQLINGLSE